MPYIIVSKKVGVYSRPVGWAYKEQPDEKDDSGWRMFHGDESQDYVDNAENLVIYDVNTIIKIDKSIVEILNAPIGSEFEKDFVTNKWIKV